MDKLINIDITTTPFSRRLSYLSMLLKKELGIYIATQRDKDSQVYSIKFFVGGKEVKPQISATPVAVTAVYGSAVCRFCLLGKFDLAIESHGMDFILYPTEYKEKDSLYGISCADGHFVTTAFGYYYGIGYVCKGKGQYISAPRRSRIGKENQGTDPVCLHVACSEGEAKVLFHVSEEQVKLNDIIFDFDIYLSEVTADWHGFLAKLPPVEQSRREFAQLSWYTLWSCIVAKSQYIKVDSVLMSMIGMTALWSWDHCFIALATANFDFQLGLDQFLLPFEIQCENGALPDCFGYNCRTIYGVTKPPIHGWCFGKLMDANPDIPNETLAYVYEKLLKQLRWWLTYRDADGDGIPDYPQGCDSGLDNSTVFIDVGKYVEAPDLCSYLILQYNTLIRIGLKLGYDVTVMQKEKEEFYAKFLKHSLIDGVFHSLKSFSHSYNPQAKSVIDYLPLVLGDLLEKPIRDKLIEGLKADMLTDYGIASESPKSRYYRRDGYWRGPIWAPTTYLILDGLRRAGETALADDITRRYLNMAIDTAKGNYENFEALSGNGLRIKGHTWTCAVSLLLLAGK